METITYEFILNAVGGKALGAAAPAAFTGISTDTRKIAPGDLFIALKGERYDANDFLKEAFAGGAAACLAQRPADGGPVILVEDTRNALHRLAAAYRKRFDIPVVGITGSVGKTSTKEMIWSVLSQKYRTHKNEGNRNNEIGMPLSVFGLTRGHTAAVFEMGMSGFGEISRLSRIAAPDIGVITNIGISHMEKLGSQENILKAKLELLEGLRPGGDLVLNGDDLLLSKVKPEGVRLHTYGIENPGCEFYADGLGITAEETSFTLHYGADEKIKVSLPVCGRHHVYNALAAFACGSLLGVTPSQATEGFRQYAPSGMRQRIEDFHGITLIKDCYNASPDSMHAAFEVLKTLKAPGRRIAVLADMLELGATSAAAHENAGLEAAVSGVDLLLAYGDYAGNYCMGFDKASGGGKSRRFEDKEKLAEAVAGEMRQGDAVLFKGSRGMKLEETIEKACERWKEQ